MSVSTTVEIKGIDKTKAAFASVNKSMGKLSKSVGGMKTAVAGLIGAAAMGGLINSLKETADRIGKLSTGLNMSVESIQKFQLAAQLGGVSTENFNKGMQKLSRSLGQAMDGNKTLIRAFNNLGVAFTDAEGQAVPMEELIKRVADGFQRIKGTGREAAAAADLFGRAGVDMLPMLTAGREGLEGMGAQLEFVGGVMSENTIRETEKLNDRFTILKQAANGVLGSFVEVVNDGLDPFFEEVENVAKPLDEQIKLIQKEINELFKQKKALKESNKEQGFFASLLGDSNKEIKEQKQELQKQIDELAKQREALKNQKKAIDDARIAQEKQVQAQKDALALKEKEEEAAKAAVEAQKKSEEAAKARAQAHKEEIEMIKELDREYEIAAQKMTAEKEQAAADEMALIAELDFEYEKSAAEYIKLEQQKAEAAKKAQKDAATSALGTIQSMAAGVKDESIELFRLYQAAAITNTTMSTYEAATKALTAGPYAGPILAGIIYALGMANVRKIANESPPQRYLGGDVAMNKSYIVGERGPELFTPGRTGTITPNNAISKSTPVLININAVDARGIDSLLHERRDTLVAIINQSLQRQTRRAI